MPGQAAPILLALAVLLASPVQAGDADDVEVPVLEDGQAVAPAPPAPSRALVTRRTSTCPPAIRLERVPVYEEVEVPVYERRLVPRLREVHVPVFKYESVPVFETRCVPVYEERCVLTIEPPCLPCVEVVRCQTGWREEQVLRGQRLERVRCGVRPHRIVDGVEEREVQTGTRTERRLVGWRAEPRLGEDPACGLRVGEGVLKPCNR